MEISKEMSIFLLSLLVGVALSRYINADDGDTEVLQPIISQTRQRRMCAELCMSGLGGDPCGEGCVDLMPAGLPIQYIPADQANTSGDSQPTANHLTRHDMCDVLCENNLGNPLCHCNATQGLTTNSNFFEVCRAFCIKHNYRIYGCQKCDLYTKGSQDFGNFSVHTLEIKQHTTVDWKLWCGNMCARDNGGAACNCDILPMQLTLKT